jgi:uncharacterized NAD(P)/FAD-binding protein YdhS
VVLGEYFAAQFWMLVKQGVAAGHSIDVKASHRILDIMLNRHDIALTFQKRSGGDEGTATFDHVVMETGQDWPEDTEISPDTSRLLGRPRRSNASGLSPSEFSGRRCAASTPSFP